MFLANKTSLAAQYFWLNVEQFSAAKKVPSEYIQFGCLGLTYGLLLVLMYMCHRSKIISKMSDILAVCSFAFLVIFMVVIITNRNAVNGIIFFMKPNLPELARIPLWKDACGQVFHSLLLGNGGIFVLSYPYKYLTWSQTKWKVLVYVFVNLTGCLVIGLITFSHMGSMAQREAIDIRDVATKSPGLILVVLSDALLQVCLLIENLDAAHKLF